MGNSLEDWKRTPTTADAIFGIHLPYRAPKNPVGAFLWRQRVWLETTFGLCLFEPWEKILIRESAGPIFASLTTSPVLWFPSLLPSGSTRIYDSLLT